MSTSDLDVDMYHQDMLSFHRSSFFFIVWLQSVLQFPFVPFVTQRQCLSRDTMAEFISTQFPLGLSPLMLNVLSPKANDCLINIYYVRCR